MAQYTALSPPVCAAFGVSARGESTSVSVLLAMFVFVLSHVIIARSGLKPWLIRRAGHAAYLSGYSLLSVLLLAWVIRALHWTDRVLLWTVPLWSYPLVGAASFVAFVLMGIGALSPNPFSVTFRRRGFRAERPGAVGWIRHPLLWGLTLWSLAHVVPNGNWPAVVLFGGAALFGLLGTLALDRRQRKRLTSERWRQLSCGAGHLDRNAVLGALAGAALWAVLLLVHPILFGGNPYLLLRAALAI